ncbi:zinc finger CCCH-type with G patch domain-containing protein-like isoform X1 [Palaemon carinicauda]|uniref:zinc finger CCCH-type with G patch domain-containing protein-like isoform X1 n=1 Tax=Palaemon carinicauda TaxID=392227 RepID=UPI0035B628C2
MSYDELCASIEVYQTQLKHIEGALVSAGAEEKQQLLELQENLLQLLDLTLQQLNQQSSIERVQDDQSDRKEDKEIKNAKRDSVSPECNDIDEEFALFQSEIACLSGNDDEKSEIACLSGNDDEKVETKYSKQYVEGLEGTKCRCPFVEKWGGHSYHNALVLSIVREEDGNIDLDCPKVRVLYVQPMSMEMLTCRYFMSGRCKFSEDSCRFSHGKIVEVSDIRKYSEPVYEDLQPGSRVLVQHSEDLWAAATIQDILEDRSAFCVKYDKSKKVAEVQAVEMIPMICEDGPDNDEEAESIEEKIRDDYSIRSGNEEMSDEDDSDDERSVFVPTSTWFQCSLTQRLGDWEKYTTGIGSKLMQKMGYIVGTGLGPSGEGRVEPVVAYVYPQGVSLDRCMELREASNGEELLQVEKRLEREKRKEEMKSAQVAERLRKRTSVFDIINKKLSGKGSEDDSDDEFSARPVVNVSKSVLQKDTTKDLNKKNFQLGENIKLLQKEINKIEESRDRHTGNTIALKTIETKLQGKKIDLHKMQEAERKVQGEQRGRKDKRKYCVF